jgi:hypothetical protein
MARGRAGTLNDEPQREGHFLKTQWKRQFRAQLLRLRTIGLFLKLDLIWLL